MESNGKKKAAVATALMVLALAAFCAEKPKDEKLLAALSSLETLEKALPAEQTPVKTLDDAERMKRAKAFFDAGKACHDLMGQFGERLGKKADRYLRASLAYRETSVTRAYLGSSHLIQARDTVNVISKISEVDIGLKEADEAVKSAPEDILTRAVRIECCIGLPAMFKRLDTVAEDLAILLKLYAEKPQAFDGVYPPARLFALKASELEQRGKNSLAEKYREKAKELSKGGAS